MARSVLQLRIELKDTSPVIWRLVLVPDTTTLVQLHKVIQESVGWWNSHLYEFEIAGMRYGMIDPEWDEDPELINEARKKLLKVLNGKKKFHYMYDFGDGCCMKSPLKKATCRPNRCSTQGV